VREATSLGPPAQWRVINHSAGVSARLISCSGHGIDPRVLTAAPEQVRPDLADLVTDSASSKARCLRSRTTEAAGCLAYRDTVPTADARQGQKLCGAIPHVAKSFMLVWNLKTLQILLTYNDVCRLSGKGPRVEKGPSTCVFLRAGLRQDEIGHDVELF
jgi:hypothetical protein